jgi:hypothetical protein
MFAEFLVASISLIHRIDDGSLPFPVIGRMNYGIVMFHEIETPSASHDSGFWIC